MTDKKITADGSRELPKRPVLRTCCACRKKGLKSGFIRIVRTPEGEIVIDPRGKISGRGTYLCRNRACIEKAEKKKAIERALRPAVAESGIYEAAMRECL